MFFMSTGQLRSGSLPIHTEQILTPKFTSPEIQKATQRYEAIYSEIIHNG